MKLCDVQRTLSLHAASCIEFGILRPVLESCPAMNWQTSGSESTMRPRLRIFQSRVEFRALCSHGLDWGPVVSLACQIEAAGDHGVQFGR